MKEKYSYRAEYIDTEGDREICGKEMKERVWSGQREKESMDRSQ